jgi:glutamate N-acetyltransferase/amino-acid N-acetyltransferase
MTHPQFDLPAGFRFAGVTCGIKKSGRPDLTLVVSEGGSVAAGVYTQNQVVAAPVVLCRQRTPGSIRAIVVNSGNANACTGQQGDADALRMTELVAEAIGCQPEQVLVMSTGIIGHHLPMDRIAAGIAAASDRLATGSDAFVAAADAILTTDQGRKATSHTFDAPNGSRITIAGMCKGAGMIGPNMATMLGIVTTDCPLSAAQADAALRHAADRSFNCISVEGHTSTNDSLVLLAGGSTMQTPEIDSATFECFQQALTDLCIDLAKRIPADGEGATHLIEIVVRGAATQVAARKIAKTIAESPLVKTAITGGDPNWGRIVSAAGYAGEWIDPKSMQLKIQSVTVYDQGAPTAFDAKSTSGKIRDNKNVLLELSVGDGSGQATFWTSDLTVDYVKFNSEYTT